VSVLFFHAGVCHWPRNPKREDRQPKEARIPNAESVKSGADGFFPGRKAASHSDFGLRASFGFRASDFGFGCVCWRTVFRDTPVELGDFPSCLKNGDFVPTNL
jgi:hypothetical protein